MVVRYGLKYSVNFIKGKLSWMNGSLASSHTPVDACPSVPSREVREYWSSCWRKSIVWGRRQRGRVPSMGELEPVQQGRKRHD